MSFPVSGGARPSLACSHFTPASASVVTLPPAFLFVSLLCLSLIMLLVIGFRAYPEYPG